MPYRPPTKQQRDAQAHRLEAMRRGKERAAMARDPKGRMPDLPLLRREVIGSKRIEWVQFALSLKVCGRRITNG